MLANRDEQSSTSSSDSDNEEINRLREAVIDISNAPADTSNLTGLAGSKFLHSTAINKVSKRINKEVVENGNSELNTTPEFRSFIAKKLGSFLDSNTECIEKKSRTNTQSLSSNDGFRLFSASHGAWMSEEDIEKIATVNHKKRRKSSSSDSSDEDNKIAEAVITDDFMMDILKNVLDKQNVKDNAHVLTDVLHSQDVDTISNKKQKKCKHKSNHKEESDSGIQVVESLEKKKHKKKKKHSTDKD